MSLITRIEMTYEQALSLAHQVKRAHRLALLDIERDKKFGWPAEHSEMNREECEKLLGVILLANEINTTSVEAA